MARILDISYICVYIYIYIFAIFEPTISILKYLIESSKTEVRFCVGDCCLPIRLLIIAHGSGRENKPIRMHSLHDDVVKLVLMERPDSREWQFGPVRATKTGFLFYFYALANYHFDELAIEISFRRWLEKDVYIIFCILQNIN